MLVDMNILGDMAWRVIHAFVLLCWHMLWPLALGFLLSAWVRTRIPASVVTKGLGNNGVGPVLQASLFGIVSSVCNYAVTGMGKTLHDKGASWPNVMVYMLASTNLGLSMLLTVYGFMGWPMLLLLAGTSVVCMALVWCLSLFLLPSASENSQESVAATGKGMWLQTAIHFYDDIAMTRNDILTGIAVASLAAALVPDAWWQALFLHGSYSMGQLLLVWLWNAVLGMVLAILTFGCSIGNVAIAAVLWWSGASAGGVMAFMLASLLTIPMLHIYYRNFGKDIMGRMALVQVLGVLCAALMADGLLHILNMTLPRMHASIDNGQQALVLLLLNIILGGAGWAFYIVGSKHSEMMGMSGMSSMGDMGDMNHTEVQHLDGMEHVQHSDHMSHMEHMPSSPTTEDKEHMPHTNGQHPMKM